MSQPADSLSPRLSLAQTPTPLQPLDRLSRAWGVEVLFKRDDLTGSEVSGNKIRKLEFLLAEAQKEEARVVLTCGGAQSNHARATAAAAARLSLGCRLLLRTPDPASPPAARANILLDRLLGAEIDWITPEQYRDRDRLMADLAAELTAGGQKAYVIPEGGSNALGALGYVRAVEELAGQLAHLPGGTSRPLTIVCATGSGGTLAGLALGVKKLGLPARVIGVNVCDDKAYFDAKVEALGREAGERFDLPRLAADEDFQILDGFVGRGYALSRPEELAAIRDLARLEGVILDPVYTGKAFFGVQTLLGKDPRALGERIVFCHTGGLFGLFPKEDELAPLL